MAALLLPVAGVSGQTASEASEYNALLRQYESIMSSLSPAERSRIEGMFRGLRETYQSDRRKVGSLSANPYLPGSTSSPSSSYFPNSPSNEYGQYGSRYSPDGARNRYSTGGLQIIGSDGTYLGNLNSNRYDPNSVANPYGKYGSRYSPNSINNPYGKYGSQYSPNSARNPYATSAPGLYTPSNRYSVPSYGTALPSFPSLPTLPSLPSLTPPGGN
jgi:hypothetical protein